MKKTLLVFVFILSFGLMANAQNGFYFTEFHSEGASSNVSFQMSGPEANGYGDYTAKEVIVNPGTVNVDSLAFVVSFNKDANINMWVDLSAMGMGWVKVVDTTGQMSSPFTGTSSMLSLLSMAPDGSFVFRIGGSANGDFPDTQGWTPTPDPSNPDWEFIDITVTIDSNYDGDMAVKNQSFKGFKFYPNPVKNNLFLQAHSAIQKIELYNVLGQKVKSLAPNRTNTHLNMSELASGIYLLKARIDNVEKTFKIIKE